MDKVQSYEKYVNILNTYKADVFHIQNNNYLMPNEIKKYIEAGRMEIETQGDTLLIYLDENTHFHLCIYSKEGEKVDVNREKPVFVRTIFRENKREKDAGIISKVLENSNFIKEATTFNVRGVYDEVWPNLLKVERYIETLKRKGFICRPATESEFDIAKKIAIDSGIIKDYHFPFKTDEEKQQMIPGSYLIVQDRAGAICATNICDVKNGVAEGTAAAVVPQYMMIGLAPMLSYYRFLWMKENSISYMSSWIAETNVKSISYHKGIGYRQMPRYADEWII